MNTPHVPENQYFIPARFRRTSVRVTGLGPRIVCELLAEAGADLDLVEQYARLDEFPAELLIAIGADRWPPDLFEVTK